MFQVQRNKITSPRQMQILVEYMNLPEHKNLALRHPTWVLSKEGRLRMEEVWNEVASILNEEEGAIRTAKEWSRVWILMKARVKKSVMINRERAKKGSKTFIKLSSYEEKVAAIMGIANLNDEDTDKAVKAISRKQSTLMQLHLLVKFMNDNLHVALGKNNKIESRSANDDYYKQITKVLNKEGPPRTPKQWSRTWIDMKCRVRSKLEKLSINYHEPSAKLTQLEELVAVIISKNPDEESDESGAEDKDNENINADDISTKEQLELLWQYLNDHRDVATSAYYVEADSHKATWEEIAHKLNAVDGGVVKDWKNWARFWTGYKNQLRSKIQDAVTVANEDKDDEDRGSDEAMVPGETYLDDMESRFLEILGETFGADNDNESSGKISMHDHNYSSGTKQTPKKTKKTLNENFSDDDNYFPENSHTNETLHDLDSHTNATYDLNSHTNAETNDLNCTTKLIKIETATQNSTCTECQANQNIEDENDKNKSFITLLSSELKYISPCVKSDAFINILTYVNNLKSKHRVNASIGPPIYNTFEVLLNNTDPLS